MRVISSDFLASFLHACSTFRDACPPLFNTARNKVRSISWPDENLTTYLEKNSFLGVTHCTSLHVAGKLKNRKKDQACLLVSPHFSCFENLGRILIEFLIREPYK